VVTGDHMYRVDSNSGEQMPRPVASQDILEVRMLQRMAGQVLMNVLHYRLGVAGASIVEGNDVVIEAATTAFENAGGIISILKGISNQAWAYEGTIYQWIHTTRYTANRRNQGAGPGVVVGLAAPPNVMSTITKRSLFADRHGVGSIHIGGMTSTDITLGMLSAGRITNLSSLGELLILDIDVSAIPNALELTPIILNKSSPGASYSWHEATVQATSRVQRRRTVGLGI